MQRGSDSSEQFSLPSEQHESSAWDQLVTAAGTLPTERREWMRRNLAALQEADPLMATVIGRRVRYPDDPGEPAALLIYPNVLVAASGLSAGYLRPGRSKVVDAVVGQPGLEEVTAIGVHIVELGPPRQQRAALDALRSLAWVDVRELPGTASRDLEARSVLPPGEVFHPGSAEDDRPGIEAAATGETLTTAGAPGDSPSAGWYIDPRGRGGLRWWDGIRWTDDMADAPSAGPVPLASPSAGRIGDPSDGRPASRDAWSRWPRVVVGVGVLVVVATAAAIWMGSGNKGGTHTPRISTSITTIAAAAPPVGPANSSSPTTVTLNISAGETITVQPVNGLHNGEVIHIVASGLTPGVQYGADECKAGGPYDDADCDNAGFQLVTAGPSGTRDDRLHSPKRTVRRSPHHLQQPRVL